MSIVIRRLVLSRYLAHMSACQNHNACFGSFKEQRSRQYCTGACSAGRDRMYL